MKTYSVRGTMTISCWTEVEASSPEEAAKLATGRDVAEMHIDTTYAPNEVWHFENDGLPMNIVVEEKG